MKHSFEEYKPLLDFFFQSKYNNLVDWEETIPESLKELLWYAIEDGIITSFYETETYQVTANQYLKDNKYDKNFKNTEF